MKKLRLSYIITLILILAAVLLVMNNRKGTLKKEVSEFAVRDTSIVTKLFFADKRNNTVKLERTAEGNWKLNDKYIASSEEVNMILKTLVSLDVKSPVAKAARNNIIRLMAAKSVKTEVYQKVYRIDLFNTIKLFPHEKLTKTFYVGDATQNNLGTYMLMEGSEDPFIVHIPGFRGFVATRFSAKEADWRSHAIFNSKLPDIRSICIQYTDKPEFSFSITNSNNRNFTLKELKSSKVMTDYDTLKVIEYLGSFRMINFEAILGDMPKSMNDSITVNVPAFTITLEKQSGEKQILKAWRRKAAPGETDLEGNPTEWDRDRMFARIEGTNELVLIQYFVFDPILKPLQWFTEKGIPRESL
jgi:hypothetical protein